MGATGAMAISAKDFAAATFIAVAAIAKRVTGADIFVTLRGIDGCARSLTGNEAAVTWLEPGAPREPSSEALAAASRMRHEEFVREHVAPRRDP